MTLTTFAESERCAACGTVGADVRPNWYEHRMRGGLTPEQATLLAELDADDTTIIEATDFSSDFSWDVLAGVLRRALVVIAVEEVHRGDTISMVQRLRITELGREMLALARSRAGGRTVQVTRVQLTDMGRRALMT